MNTDLFKINSIKNNIKTNFPNINDINLFEIKYENKTDTYLLSYKSLLNEYPIYSSFLIKNSDNFLKELSIKLDFIQRQNISHLSSLNEKLLNKTNFNTNDLIFLSMQSHNKHNFKYGITPSPNTSSFNLYIKKISLNYKTLNQILYHIDYELFLKDVGYII